LEVCPRGNNNMLLFISGSLLMFISLCYNCYDTWIWDSKENSYARV